MRKLYIRKIFGPLCLMAALAIHIPAKADPYMPEMKITYDPGALNYDTYIEGTMELTDLEGIPVSHQALFKTRGATARQYPMKPSLNMKLRDDAGEEVDDNLLGIRKASSFILDAMAIDRINMRNRVCFDIWNSFSTLPYDTDFDRRNGTRGEFVELYINGEYKGIYCLTDKINRKLLGLKKPKVDDTTGDVTVRGVLYKHGTNDIADQTVPGFYEGGIVWVARPRDAWELHEPEEYPGPETWAPMTDLYDNNNFSNYNYVKEHFNLENLADYTVHLMALSIADNWGNKNKYFSIANIQGDADENRFIVTPWDLDTSLGGSWDGSYYDGNYSNWAVADIAKNAPLPFSCAMGQPEFKNLLRESWRKGREVALSVENVTDRLETYCNYFINSGAWQRTVDYWSTQKYTELYVEDLRKEISLIEEWYARRFQEMDDYFGISGDGETGIGAIEVAPEATDAIYTLQGIKVADTSRPGIYIINGKKVTVR